MRLPTRQTSRVLERSSNWPTRNTMVVGFSVQASQTNSTIFEVDVISLEINVSKGEADGRSHSHCCGLFICYVVPGISAVPDLHTVALGSIRTSDGGSGRV